MKKKIFIIQSFFKHILYTSLVHQTPLRMRKIAPNYTIFFKIFLARLVQPLAMSLQPLAKLLVEALCELAQCIGHGLSVVHDLNLDGID